jgi:ribosomal protein S27AE
MNAFACGPCLRCGDTDSMDFFNDARRRVWICGTCASTQTVAQSGVVAYRGAPNQTPWREIEAVVVLFSTEPAHMGFYASAQSELMAQQRRIEPLMTAAGIESFHALFVFSDTPPIELAYVLMQCRRFDAPLLLADSALLFGTDLTGLHLIAPYRVAGRA